MGRGATIRRAVATAWVAEEEIRYEIMKEAREMGIILRGGNGIMENCV